MGPSARASQEGAAHFDGVAEVVGADVDDAALAKWPLGLDIGQVGWTSQSHASAGVKCNGPYVGIL
jgi:hypothetical protein